MAERPTRMEWDTEGFIRILNGPKMTEVLDVYADFALSTAEGVYASANKGQGKPPVLYEESFFVRRRNRLTRGGGQVQTRQVGNSDPEWVFVEFGLNAGNTGRVYKYRVFGRTMDVLESEGVTHA